MAKTSTLITIDVSSWDNDKTCKQNLILSYRKASDSNNNNLNLKKRLFFDVTKNEIHKTNYSKLCHKNILSPLRACWMKLYLKSSVCKVSEKTHFQKSTFFLGEGIKKKSSCTKKLIEENFFENIYDALLFV